MSLSWEFIPPPPAVPERPPTPPAKPAPRPVRIKATYHGRTAEFYLEPVTQDIFGWQALQSRLKTKFDIWNITVKYIDDGGDCVSMDSQEEYEEAIKVAQTLGTLQLIVDGDPYNSYIEDLHIKLSKPVASSPPDDAMDTSQTPSPSQSYVDILHSELSKRPVTQVKFHPYRRSSGSAHYAELARNVGAERNQPLPTPPSTNEYIDAYHNKLTGGGGAVATPTNDDNPYIEQLHQHLGGKVKMPPTLARSPASPKITSPSKNEYVEALHAKLMKMGSDGRQPVAPSPTGQPATSSVPSVVHYNISCDGCDAIIRGARYKCGNCLDYDLCASCEPMSETIHRPDHVFLKIKIPATRAGVNKKGKMRPLLKRNLYQFTCHSSDEEIQQEEREHHKRSHHHHHRRHHTGHGDEATATAVLSGYVTRPKDKLKEAIKMRKREEKQKAKMEKKVEKLGTKLAATTVSTPKTAGGEKKQRGHGKYLDCQFITDTCYPDDSLVPFNVPFEKGWLVMNSGTKRWKHVKLIHTDGFRPLCPEVDVPELKPGERVELVAKYPPITDSAVDSIKSSWRLVHKESTAFGPLLWLQVRVDKGPLVIYPPVIAVPLATPPLPECSLNNETLLKSIGFVPGGADSAHPVDEGEEEELLTTFDVVETPKDSELSFSSYASLTQPTVDGDPTDVKLDVDDDAASVASNDSDFVVVIPDCFDLDKPLPGFSSIRSTTSLDDPTASIKSHDSHVTSHDEMPQPKVDVPVTSVDPEPVVGGASPDTARKANFVPERITLKQIKDGRRYRNPITVATGLVNTVTDLMDRRIHFGPKKTPPTDSSSSDSDDDDAFEDAPEVLSGASNDGQSTGVSQWVKSEEKEDMRKWCHNPDISHLLPLRWDGPKTPATPMERLIGMGFADRQLNAQLLEKHNNDLTSVLNELLDGQRQAYGGGAADRCINV